MVLYVFCLRCFINVSYFFVIADIKLLLVSHPIPASLQINKHLLYFILLTSPE